MCHGWRFGLIVVAGSLLISCGPGKVSSLAGGITGSSAWSQFPIPIYADSKIASNPQRKADFIDAMTFWEQKAQKKLFDYQGEWNHGVPYEGSPAQPTRAIANVIFFQNAWPFGLGVTGMTTVFSNQDTLQSGLIMINPNTPYCFGDCQGPVDSIGGQTSGQTSERNTFTHELGHFLGLPHTNDPLDIMYPTVISTRDLSNIKTDLNRLTSLTSK